MTTTGKKTRAALLVALALPLVGSAAMMVRGELALRGREWEFPIRGYDPRDLLRGHYLTFRIDWGVGRAWASSADSCLCLQTREGRPLVTLEMCSTRDDCEAQLTQEQVRELERYYVPEERARELEEAVRRERATLVLSSVRGRVAIKDLKVDGKPWREALR